MAGKGLPGPRRIISDEVEELLREQHRESPYLTLAEHRDLLESSSGIKVSVPTLSNHFRRLGLPVGKMAALERVLREQVRLHPHLTLEEHQRFLKKDHGVSASISTLSVTFERLGLRKVSQTKLEEQLRAQYLENPDLSVDEHVRLIEENSGVSRSYNTVRDTFERLGLPLRRGPRTGKAQLLAELLPEQIRAHPVATVNEHIRFFEDAHGVKVSYHWMRQALNDLGVDLNPISGGRKHEALLKLLPEQQENNPELTIQGHRELLKKKHGIEVGYTTIQGALAELGIEVRRGRPGRQAASRETHSTAK
jgi:transposase